MAVEGENAHLVNEQNQIRSQELITLWKQMFGRFSWRERMHHRLRETAIFFLSLVRPVDRSSGWIRVLYYHFVFDDERKGFAYQLDYLRNYAEFVPLDEAVALLKSGSKIDGRYLCVTFDDGFKNNVVNAVPILVDKGVEATFFVATKYIGIRSTNGYMDRNIFRGFRLETLSWDDCRQMVAAGMTIGSHSVSHPRLVDLSRQQAAYELQESKDKIERETGARCNHFACPYGRPFQAYDPGRDPALAQETGYRSFLTTVRGRMVRGDSPYLVKRYTMGGYLGTYRLRFTLAS